LIETCQNFDTIELWIAPEPHAQLVLIQLLDFVGPYAEIVRKLMLRHAEDRIAERGPADIARSAPSAETVEAHHLETARLAWNAFRQPTPEAWRALLTRDLTALPHLRRSVLTLMDELPAAGTALGATERLLLTPIHRWWGGTALTNDRLWRWDASSAALIPLAP